MNTETLQKQIEDLQILLKEAEDHDEEPHIIFDLTSKILDRLELQKLFFKD